MSKQQDDLINNVLDEGLHQFVNQNKSQLSNQYLQPNNTGNDNNNIYNNTYLMNPNNNTINNKELYYTTNNNYNVCNQLNDKTNQMIRYINIQIVLSMIKIIF